jgi:hypothetical protein
VIVSDSFTRADGAIGSNWKGPFTSLDGVSSVEGVVGIGGILISGNAYGPVVAHSADSYAVWNGVGFANDQWASAKIAAIAPNISTLHITAASFAAGVVTYTYTVTQGAALINGQEVIVSGMQNVSNNGQRLVTGSGGGNFTANTAAGTNEAASTGTGVSPSDSNSGLVLRGTPDGLNGYFLVVGTNSYATSSSVVRVYDLEVWKYVAGVGTYLAGLAEPFIDSVPDAVNDIYAFWAIGNTLRVSKNGIEITTNWDHPYPIVDSSLTSGRPGIWTWSLSGPNEYNWANWGNVGVMGSDPPGNNGTRWNNWQGGDAAASYAQITSDTLTEFNAPSDAFPYANGDLHAANANWVYEGASAFSIATNKCYYAAASPGLAYRADVSPAGNDQWAQATMVITGSSATQNVGPAVRLGAAALTAYIVQCGSDLLQLTKYVNGTPTALASATPNSTANGDIILLTAEGSILTVYKNATQVIQVTDSAIAGGNIGIFGAGNATVNGFSAWSGGCKIDPVNGSSLSSVGFSFFSYSANGAFGVKNTTSVSTRIAVDSTLAWQPNHYAQGVLPAAAEPTLGIGPGVRIDNLSDNGYILTHIGGKALINRISGGAPTTLSSVPHVYNPGDTYRLEAQGNLLVGKINGVVIVEAIDATYSTGTPGIFGSTNEPTQSIMNWASGTTAPSPPQAGGGGDLGPGYDFKFRM